MIHYLPRWLTIVAAMLLTGCSILPSKSTLFYVLGPVGPQTSGAELQAEHELSIKVFSVRLPQYLDRPQIVTRSDANRLTLAEYHQWGGNLRKSMTRVLAQNLSVLLHTPRVHIAPHHGPARADVHVEVEIMQFERTPNGHVRLSAQWRLVDGTNGEVRTVKIAELGSASGHAAGDYDSIVSAMSTLYGELSGLIATEIRNQYPDT